MQSKVIIFMVIEKVKILSIFSQYVEVLSIFSAYSKSKNYIFDSVECISYFDFF